MEKISFAAADGYTLKGLWAVPVAAYKGTIIINAATGVKKNFTSALHNTWCKMVTGFCCTITGVLVNRHRRV
jgi:predicted alpha/beta hydrolase